jgi:hypothetical protein
MKNLREDSWSMVRDLNPEPTVLELWDEMKWNDASWRNRLRNYAFDKSVHFNVQQGTLLYEEQWTDENLSVKGN